MPIFFKLPKVQLSLSLILISLTIFTVYEVTQSLFVLIISLGSTVLFDLFFTFIRRRVFFIPYAAIATGLIIALIYDPNASFYQILLVSGIAMAAKNFIRLEGRHIFNPAAFGLLFGGIIFSQHISWWGVSFQSIETFTTQNLILFLILLTPAIVSIYRMRKIYSILTFILSYALLSHLGTAALSLTSIFSRIFDPTVLFFSLVMLPEPMTSPVKPERQVLYGLLVAIIAQLLTYPQISNNLPDLLIPALLLGNLIFFKFR